MDPRSFLHSSINNLSNHMDSGFYQFVEEQHDPILPPFPPTLDTISSFPMDPPNPMDSSNPIANLMRTQRLELVHCLRSQNELLIESLQQQRVRHLTSLMGAYETIVKQKDEELIQIRKQVFLLGECLKREREEKEAWRRQEKEAMTDAPSGTLEQILYSTRANKEDVGSSFRAPQKGREEQAEGAKFIFIPCKSCGSRHSCMLFLPCRHLCTCKICAAFLDACPVCNVEKIDSIEVSFD